MMSEIKPWEMLLVYLVMAGLMYGIYELIGFILNF